jgi:hypothetical protein
MKKQNIKYQGGNTGYGVDIPWAGLSHCTDPNALNYLWYCNYQTEDGGDPLCAWDGQEALACSE